ncbi:9413_t:CDS:2 [Paraglomus occultum]|uniref:9413_t:CDS:1 n=1 Tax=Paraglomus occultum TaxID=144539 RepID=A0A9N8VLG5_9GLOM|nr:9413_t:CDS:2 [Paraglomus occultum]
MPPNHIEAYPQITIPRLEDYDIDPVTGFLPSIPPLRRLPDPYYEPWESLLDIFHDLMLAGRLRECIGKLEILKTDRLKTPAEFRRAFLVLSILAHGYIWGNFEPVVDRLPAGLAIPWVKVSAYLEVAPIVNHAAVVLWNWRLIFPNEPLCLNNLATLDTYSNTLDESWFYLVTTAIEGVGGRALAAIISAFQAARDANNKDLIASLTDISTAISDIRECLQRMYEKCDPYVFYWKVRPYLAGWENEDRLPKGIIYEGVDGVDEKGETIFRQYVGASAGQSALIQALDIALNVEHYPTNTKTKAKGHSNIFNSTSSKNSFSYYPYPNNIPPVQDEPSITPRQPYLHKIRQNIPGPHRRFLEDLAKIAHIREYIMSQADCDNKDVEVAALVDVYNECLNKMNEFRNKHLQIVSVYIINQARKAGGLHFNSKDHAPSLDKGFSSVPKTSANTLSSVASVTTTVENSTTTHSGPIKGTGGTDLMPFLKQMRDETASKEIVRH